VEDLRIEGRGGIEVPARGLTELLDPLPDVETIAGALVASFAAELELEAKRVDLSPAERAAAESAYVRYEDEAWTWRR